MAQLITRAQQAVLRALGEGPAEAVSLHDVERLLPQVKRVSACLFRLHERGWLARERREDPERHRTSPYVTNFWRYYYWRAPAGTEMLHRLASGAGVWVLSPEEEAQRHYRRPDDDEALLQSYNRTRGAVTFRATMAEFGFTTVAEVRAMPLPTWRRFQDRWSAHMYAACAEAGEPICLDEPPARRGADD